MLNLEPGNRSWGAYAAGVCCPAARRTGPAMLFFFCGLRPERCVRRKGCGVRVLSARRRKRHAVRVRSPCQLRFRVGLCFPAPKATFPAALRRVCPGRRRNWPVSGRLCSVRGRMFGARGRVSSTPGMRLRPSADRGGRARRIVSRQKTVSVSGCTFQIPFGFRDSVFGL